MGLTDRSLYPDQPCKVSSCNIVCDPEKLEYLQQLTGLKTETLKILAKLSKKPGAEQKLKTFQHLV